jgi:hypothetical protein
MKIYKLLLSAALIGALLTYSGCSKDSAPAPSVKDQQLKALSQTWKCTSATLQGAAQTGYTSFQLVISGTSGQDTFGFTTTGRPPGTKTSPWPASGSFTFGTDPATQLTRDDSGTPLPITYSVSATQLQMTFTYSGPGFDARVSNVVGVWVYTFGL